MHHFQQKTNIAHQMSILD